MLAPCTLPKPWYVQSFQKYLQWNFIHLIHLLLYRRILDHYNNAENESNHVFQIVDHDGDDLVSWPVYKAQLLGLDPGKYEHENSTSELLFCISFFVVVLRICLQSSYSNLNWIFLSIRERSPQQTIQETSHFACKR